MMRDLYRRANAFTVNEQVIVSKAFENCCRLMAKRYRGNPEVAQKWLALAEQEREHRGRESKLRLGNWSTR
jgi:hypothetical protein